MFPQPAIGAMKTRRFRNAIGLATLGDTDTLGIGLRRIPAIGDVTLGNTDTIGSGRIVGFFTAIGDITLGNTDTIGSGRILSFFTAIGDITLGNTDTIGSGLLNVLFASGEATLGNIDVSGIATVTPRYNDSFANRITLTGSNVSTNANNALATGEAGEPALSGDIESLWWQWTAPSSASFNINTVGSNFDTYLGIYTGSGLSVGSLTEIARDDDSGGNNASRVIIPFTSGTTYYIRVEGFSSNRGNIVLNISPG